MNFLKKLKTLQEGCYFLSDMYHSRFYANRKIKAKMKIKLRTKSQNRAPGAYTKNDNTNVTKLTKITSNSKNGTNRKHRKY